MITTGSLTFDLSIWPWFFYPNNPAQASLNFEGEDSRHQESSEIESELNRAKAV